MGARQSALGLRGVKLLAGLDAQTLEWLAQQCRWRHIAAGQRVTSRETPDRDVYLIVAGRVRITAFSAGGRQVTFRDIGAGEAFGRTYDYDNNGRRFLMIRTPESPEASTTLPGFVVVQNWFEELKRLVPTR